MPALERGKELTEVQLLAAIGDVDDLSGLPGIDAVRQGGQVRAGVVEPAVALLNDKRVRNPLAFFMDEKRVVLGRHGTIREDDKGPAALGGNAPAHPLVHAG